MSAGSRYGDFVLTLRRPGGEFQMICVLVVNVHGLVIAFRSLAHIDELRAVRNLFRVIAQCNQIFVISVQDRCAAGLQALEDFTFCLENIFLAAQIPDMGLTDVGDDRRGRTADAGEIADLAAMVHAHLHDRSLDLVIQTQQRPGQADVVVQIALGLQRIEMPGHHSSGHFLGGRLADTAGNRENRNVELCAVPARQIARCQHGVLHHTVELIVPQHIRNL